MAKLFQILAVVLAGVAAYFIWTGDRDGVFVAAVLAACSLFLSVRFQAKGRLNEHEAEKHVANETEILPK